MYADYAVFVPIALMIGVSCIGLAVCCYHYRAYRRAVRELCAGQSGGIYQREVVSHD